MRTKSTMAALMAALLFALPALADWSSAESEDFTLDTTVPEPGAALLIVAGMVYATRRDAR